MMMIASLGVFALFFLNQALRLTSPVVVSFIRVTDIVVSYILQVLVQVLHDHPSVLAILGSSFVIISVSLLSIEQYIVKLYLLLSDIIIIFRVIEKINDYMVL